MTTFFTPDPAHDVTGNGEFSHYELAEQLQMRGYDIEIDSDDNERSEVWYMGARCGEINGDNPATVTTLEIDPTNEQYWELWYYSHRIKFRHTPSEGDVVIVEINPDHFNGERWDKMCARVEKELETKFGCKYVAGNTDENIDDGTESTGYFPAK